MVVRQNRIQSYYIKGNRWKFIFEGDKYLMAYIDIRGYFNNEEPFSSYTTKDKTTKKTHLKILEKEINILEKEYYKSDSEGTGHYNTAISVLKERINDINKK